MRNPEENGVWKYTEAVEGNHYVYMDDYDMEKSLRPVDEESKY